MKGKKGVMESQFNWLFVFLVGAAILLFFVGFITSQSKQSEQRLGEKVSKDLNTIITQTSISVGKADIVKIPSSSINFNCFPETCNKQGCTSGFTIGGSNVGWPTPVQVLFSPDLIKGNSLVSWSLSWNMPYHATNFLYLTSPQIRYIFVDTNPEIRKMFADFPDLVNKDLIDIDKDQVFFQNNYKVKLIYYNESISAIPPEITDMPTGSITAVRIMPEPGKEEYGEVTFYQNIRGDQTLYEVDKAKFLGKPSMYGAIFSENIEMYECNMKKALIRLYLATAMYHPVVTNYSNNPGVSDVCQSFFNDITPISQIGIASQSLDLNRAEGIIDNATLVRELNHNLKIFSCPLIY